MTEACVQVAWAHPRPGGRMWLRCDAAAEVTIGAVPLSAPGLGVDAFVPLADEPLLIGDAIATVQVARLATQDETHWLLVAASDGELLPVDVRSVPDAVRTVSVIEAPDGGYTIETAIDDRGRFTIRLRPRQVWVEVGHPRQSGRIVTYQGRLAGLAGDMPCPGDELAAFLIDRERGTEVPVSLEGTAASATIRIDLDTVIDLPGHHNLVVRSSLGDHRAGWHLDDIPAKNRSLATPHYARPGTNGQRHAQPRYTDRGNVVVTVSDERPTPVPSDPRSTWETEHGDLLETCDIEDSTSWARFCENLVLLGCRAWFAVTSAASRRRRAFGHRHPRRDGPTDVYLLVANRHAIGGTVRATTNMANALARHTNHRVHLISVYQLEDLDPFPLDPEVHAEVLVDGRHPPSGSGGGIRGWIRRSAYRQPTRLIPRGDGRAYRFSLWTDIILVRRLRAIHDGVVVPTRAGLSIVATRYTRAAIRVVAQQHLPFNSEAPELRPVLLDAYRRCDVVTALTEADADQIRAGLGVDTPSVHVIPNSVEEAVGIPTDVVGPERVLCIGRLSPVKGTDLLIEAFAQVQRHRSTTELRFVGPARRDRLDAMRALAIARSVEEQTSFLPASPRVEAELLQASLCVVPSRHEAFGMVIVEALNLGVPVVAFDCPNGPGEIITHNVDGLLVPPRDVDALADAIVRVLSDQALRESLSRAGRHRAGDFSAAAVAARFDEALRTG